jgi:hypothetical protein
MGRLLPLNKGIFLFPNFRLLAFHVSTLDVYRGTGGTRMIAKTPPTPLSRPTLAHKSIDFTLLEGGSPLHKNLLLKRKEARFHTLIVVEYPEGGT